MPPFAAVRERLKLLAATPADGRICALLLLATVAIAAAIAALMILSPDDSAPNKPPARAAARPQAMSPPAPTLTAADLNEATRAARRFLPGYLAHSYGRRRPILNAAPDLAQDLASRRLPRVPPDVRSRSPRVARGLSTEGSNPQRVILGAFVDDGSVSYTIQLRLERTPTGAWLVTGVTR